MGRYLPIIIVALLMIYCVVEVAQAPPLAVRRMPRWLWAVAIICVPLVGAVAAPPCVEFSRFCLGLPPGPVGPHVRQALDELDGGARGYYAQVRGTGRVERGARLLRA